MLELKNVSKYYNNNGVVTLGLRNINLNFDKNEIVAIVGESGSGKSTLLNVICAGDTYEEGEILFEGYETSYFNREDMDTFRKQNVSFIYQNYNIIDSYTVLENVMFPLLIKGVPYEEAKKKALELIDEVGLSKRVKNRGVKLSGGEKQRCVIARALATDAPILACDEPTGNLDSKTGADIIKLIKEVASDKLVLIVTHNYEQVEGIVTRTIKMADGEVVNDTNVNNNQTLEVKDGDIFNEEAKKIKYKTIASIGSNNLRRTPKKNIFVFLVLLVLSFIGLYLFSQAYSSSIESEYNSYPSFANDVRERIILYKDDHTTFDDSPFSDYETYRNAFYEDATVALRNQNIDFYLYMNVCVSSHMPYSAKHEVGEKEFKDNQGYLVLPKNNYLDDYTINGIVECRSLKIYGIGNIDIDIVGVATSDEISTAILVANQDYIVKTLKINYFDATLKLAKGGVGKENAELDYLLIDYSDVSKPTLHLTGSSYDYIGDITYVDSEMKAYSKTINISDCDIVYSSDYDYIELPYNFDRTECYELTVYTSDMDKVEKIAEANGLKYIIPSKSGRQLLSFSFIVFVVSLIFACLVMILLVFISYAVLQKVYQSRSKDYAIMRSLGLMKPQMAKMIRFEVLTLGAIAAVISVILLGVTVYFTRDSVDMNLVKAIFSPWFIGIYLVLMLLFDLRLANKFNRKLFKFSVTKTIKEVF